MPPRFRSLYLLALFQLVAGPAVLMGVIVLGKLTVRELPRHGVATAFANAWHSEEFQTLIRAVDHDVPRHSSEAPFPTPETGAGKLKLHWLTWSLSPSLLWKFKGQSIVVGRAIVWTPAWPHAPPGQPPKVALS